MSEDLLKTIDQIAMQAMMVEADDIAKYDPRIEGANPAWPPPLWAIPWQLQFPAPSPLRGQNGLLCTDPSIQDIWRGFPECQRRPFSSLAVDPRPVRIGSLRRRLRE